jgi:hypothetical protein
VLGQGTNPLEILHSWIDQYRQDLVKSEQQLKKQFGVDLEYELGEIGLSLSGQYPDLKAGLFTIELDFEKERVTLWYGPKQERLDQCPFSVAKVVALIEKVRKQLGSRLSKDEFLSKLQEAYSRTAGSELGEPVSIIGVLAELAYLLQSSQFRQDPRRENYRGYSRADFSYDLFQVRQSGSLAPLDKRLQLVVATRAHTRRRQDFLWVPDDESGRGATYSHLQFQEATL